MTWRKSSFSANETACVELARPVDGVAVRDSKNPDGPVLLLSPPALAALVATMSGPCTVLSV